MVGLTTKWQPNVPTLLQLSMQNIWRAPFGFPVGKVGATVENRHIYCRRAHSFWAEGEPFLGDVSIAIWWNPALKWDALRCAPLLDGGVACLLLLGH